MKPGKYDLVLDPSHLWLTIHESVGHPTELDRVLGYEANYAGTSFATLDKWKSEELQVRQRHGQHLRRQDPARRRSARSATTTRASRRKRWDLIKDGILVNYQAIRDQAHILGQNESHGCCYADSWSDVQFQRMPNVSLAPGKEKLTPDEMIKDVENGIYIIGDGSFSIDQQRYNFQFGGQLFYEIKNGKITQMLDDVAYQSNTQEFWNSCVGVCDDKRLPPGRLVLRRQGPARPGQRRVARLARRRASTASTSSTPRASSAERRRRHEHHDRTGSQARSSRRCVKLSKADDCTAQLTGIRDGNIRYARNTVSTAGIVNNTDLAVQSHFGKRVGTATINEFDDASLEKVVRRAEELAKLAPENPEFMPRDREAGLQAERHASSRRPPRSRRNTAPRSPPTASSRARRTSCVAAGFFTDSARFTAIAEHARASSATSRSTNVDFTVHRAHRRRPRLGLGRAQSSTTSASSTPRATSRRRDRRRPTARVDAKAIEPGKYTVILEPAASRGPASRS